MEKSLAQFIRFCLVGFVGAIINYSLFFIFYNFLGIYYIISSAMGFICSIIVAFTLNKNFTFKISIKEKYNLTLIKYFLVNLFSLTLGLLFLKLFVEHLGINVYLSNLLIIGIQTISNFTGSKLLVFK